MKPKRNRACSPCVGFRHTDCRSIEDGPVDLANEYERLCCCGIPVDVRRTPDAEPMAVSFKETP
jgi:hypothetical protein